MTKELITPQSTKQKNNNTQTHTEPSNIVVVRKRVQIRTGRNQNKLGSVCNYHSTLTVYVDQTVSLDM